MKLRHKSPLAPVEGALALVQTPDISVLVLAAERPGSLLDLYREFSAPLRDSGYTFEFIFVAHPGFESLTVPLEALAAAGEPVRFSVTGRSVGETALLRLGVSQSRGEIIVTLPAYRQTAATGIIELIGQVEHGADIAVARRWPRHDALFNRIQSRIFHRFVGHLTGNRVHDMGCSVRAIRREVLEDLPLYGDFARFLPILALDRGYRLVEVPTPQHHLDRPVRVYSPGIYLRRVIDVLGLVFLLRFTDKPLRFFGLIGAALTGIGSVLMLVLLAERLQAVGIGQRPLLLLAVLMVTLGAQAIALGLIGEIIVHLNSTGRRRYRVRRPMPAPAQNDER